MSKWIVAGKLFACEAQALEWAGKIYRASGIIVAVERIAIR